MSKPLTDDPDLPPEPGDFDLPPEPSLRSASISVASSAAPAAAAPLAEELLGSADQAAAPSVSAEGDILTVGGARYRITRRLGAGGMGEVFLATRLGTGGFERHVALKTVLPALAGHAKSSTFLKSFTDEARLAAMLHHPGICQVMDLQPLEGRGLIQVLEYVDGHALKAIIETVKKKNAALSEAFACFVAAELASALDYAHNATDAKDKPLGIIHRDVTPHNIMVSKAGAVKLLDFGIAFSSLENRDATTSNMVKGKDQYYAPEQLVGAPLDGRSDQFALALCLYEMLTLKRFFTRARTDTDTALHMRIAQLTPESVEGQLDESTIDPSLKKILHHALAPSRDERFPTCAEFGDALRVFSQRRGWLFTAADAKKELEALFALPDVDSEKTNPSGKRAQSAPPRRVPGSTVQFAPLTPGRTASTPPLPKPEMNDSASVAKAVPPGATPEPVRKLQREFFASGEAEPEMSSPSQPAVVPPSQTQQRRRLQLEEDLHNPQTKAKKQLVLPAIVLAATLVVGVGVVKMLKPDDAASKDGAFEVVKTPEQLRAEQEAAERAKDTAAAPPPQLAPAPIVEAPAQPPELAVAPKPTVRPKRANADAKAVNDLLATQYGGGRPVVTPDSPGGSVDGTAAPQGPRRRSLDTVMVGDFGANAPAADGAPLPRGTSIAARLTSPADASQPAPVTATVSADVVVAGSLVVPKGSTLLCTTAPAGARLGLNCDTVQLRGRTIALEATAMGSDRRVGLPLPRSAVGGDSSYVGDVAREGALNTGRTLLGRVTPDGVAGDLTNGAADTASQAARGGARGGSAERPGVLLPVGTGFTLYVNASH